MHREPVPYDHQLIKPLATMSSMGLLLAAVAIQFMLNALKELSPRLFEAL